MDVTTEARYSLTVAQQRELLNLADLLESGTIKQGFGALRMTDADNTVYMCCLGVAANRINPNAWAAYSDGQPGSSGLISFGTRPNALAEDGITTWWWRGDHGVDNANLPDDAAETYGISVDGSFHIMGLLPDDAPQALQNTIGRSSSLVVLNDGGNDFAAIAAVIRYILGHPDVLRFDPYDGRLTELVTDDFGTTFRRALPPEPMPETA